MLLSLDKKREKSLRLHEPRTAAQQVQLSGRNVKELKEMNGERNKITSTSRFLQCSASKPSQLVGHFEEKQNRLSSVHLSQRYDRRRPVRKAVATHRTYLPRISRPANAGWSVAINYLYYWLRNRMQRVSFLPSLAL